MLEKLITNLKNSLPAPLRKMLGMRENIDEESEENELSNDESGEVSDASEEEKKKKRISMIIRVVVIIAIGYFAIDEFVLNKSGSDGSGTDKNSEATLMANAEAKAAAKIKKRKEAMAKAEQEKKAAEATVATTTTTTAPVTGTAETATAQVPDAPADTIAPIENVNVLDKNNSQAAVETKTDTPAVEAPAEVVESKIVDTSVDHKLDQLVDNVEQSPSTAPTEEVKIPSQSTEPVEPKKETSMASKIVEEAVESPPPAYDQIGRGLVYNCKDKYWACVDKPAYVSCNKNMKWNKSKGNSMECAIQNIYNTDEDCAKIQKYNVSINQATDFCK